MSAHCYRLVVEGELGPRSASALDGMTVSAHGGNTEIVGPIVDQSHLQGLLERIAGLGLTLHSLTPLEAENVQAAPRPHTQRAGLDANELDTDQRDVERMTFLWILLGIVYVACWIYFGLTTFRKGHYVMFWVGFILPILWIIGTLIGPTQRAAARA